jgi:hypothetical protein
MHVRLYFTSVATQFRKAKSASQVKASTSGHPGSDAGHALFEKDHCGDNRLRPAPSFPKLAYSNSTRERLFG